MNRFTRVLGFVVAALSPALAAEWQVAQWQQTVYYRYTFNATEAAQAVLRLTAVDDYEVFLNGQSVGADAARTRMEKIEVE